MVAHECKYAEDIGEMKSSIKSIQAIGGWTITFIVGEILVVVAALGTFVYSWSAINTTVIRHDSQIVELQDKCGKCNVQSASAENDNSYHAN